MRATAIAHPNIALAKYWGKREGEGNYPAVPSLSVTLRGMATRTTVTFASRAGDRFVLDGAEAGGEPRARVVAMLDRVRAAAGLHGGAVVESANDFPTASGLASSASGFAALALAATSAAGLAWDAARVSDLARRSSASAARSLFGGFVELDAGLLVARGDEMLGARVVAPRDHLDVAVLVCVTTEQAKTVGSTDGMRETAARSPYYARWLDDAPRAHASMREALLAKDLERVGALVEASAFQMHACAMAAGVVYVGAATGPLLATVRALRARGTGAWATMDAGPHVKVLVRAADVDAVSAALAAVPGVLRVLDARPGEGARLAAREEAVA